MNKFGYKFLKLLLKPVYKFYYNPKIYCKENLNIDGPIIIAGNHIHLMDQCNVIISSKRVINYMAKKEYFDNNPYNIDEMYIFCGDYTDRGLQNKETLLFLMELAKNKNVLFWRYDFKTNSGTWTLFDYVS